MGNVDYSNTRKAGESFEAYRSRLRAYKHGLAQYMRYGSVGAVIGKAADGRRYGNGPGRTEQPHEVKEMLTTVTGRLVERVVVHPGTLRKMGLPMEKRKVKHG